MNDNNKQNPGFGALDDAANEAKKDTAQNNKSNQGQKGGQSNAKNTKDMAVESEQDDAE